MVAIYKIMKNRLRKNTAKIHKIMKAAVKLNMNSYSLRGTQWNLKDIHFRYIKEVLFYAAVRECQKHNAEKSVKVQKGCEKDTYKKGLDSFLEDSPKTKFQADCIGLTWQGFSNRGGVCEIRSCPHV